MFTSAHCSLLKKHEQQRTRHHVRTLQISRRACHAVQGNSLASPVEDSCLLYEIDEHSRHRRTQLPLACRENSYQDTEFSERSRRHHQAIATCLQGLPSQDIDEVDDRFLHRRIQLHLAREGKNIRSPGSLTALGGIASNCHLLAKITTPEH